jgi:hypothetical protein
MPLYCKEPPGDTAVVGHTLVTEIFGVVKTGHVAVAVSVTTTPVHVSLPVAVTVLQTSQQLMGTV